MKRRTHYIILALAVVLLVLCGSVSAVMVIPGCLSSTPLPSRGLEIDNVRFTVTQHYFQYEKLNSGHRLWISRFYILIDSGEVVDYVQRRTFIQVEFPLSGELYINGGLADESHTFDFRGLSITKYDYDEVTRVFSIGKTRLKINSCFGFQTYQIISPNEDT